MRARASSLLRWRTLRHLTATVRPLGSCTASYTSPIPPAAMSERIRYPSHTSPGESSCSERGAPCDMGALRYTRERQRTNHIASPAATAKNAAALQKTPRREIGVHKKCGGGRTSARGLERGGAKLEVLPSAQAEGGAGAGGQTTVLGSPAVAVFLSSRSTAGDVRRDRKLPPSSARDIRAPP